MRRWFSLATVIAALAGVVGVAMAASGPTADYRFQHSRQSSVAGAADLVDVGPGINTFGKERVAGKSESVLKFPLGNGVSLSPTTGVIPNAEYTIVVLFNFDDVTGWRRIVDFKNGVGEPGLYQYSGTLKFYPVQLTGPTTMIADTYYQVALTRTAAGVVTGYIDGVQQWQFDDSSTGYGIIDGNNTLRFFIDNCCLNENAAGAVARIQLFDHALIASEVAAVPKYPPKPTLKDAPASGPPGTMVTLTGANFGPNETVRFFFIDAVAVKTVLGTQSSDTPGNVLAQFTVPAGAAPGVGKFQAMGLTSGLKKTVKFTVN